MDLSNDNLDFIQKHCYVNDLPDEILEYILGLLRPYSDLKKCMLVCKRWNRSALRVLHHKKSNFNRCLINFNITWEHYTPPDKIHSISKRYSHSACSYGNSMYVFGGCTCTSTTFNDLWRLDLSSRKWFRLLTMGTYPTPKALATLVHHEGFLVLFGGWTHPTPFPLHQAWRTFNELHVYDIHENRWSCVMTPTLSPPPMAGHSASVHKDDMVVFGGICGDMVTGSANDIWCYNFLSQSWRKQETTNPKPIPRYNQSQIAIDDYHLLIIGGCGGRPNVILHDVWLLTMQGNVWQWRTVTVENPHWGTSHPNGQMWCHPACKVGTNVVIVGRNPTSTAPSFSLPKWNLMQRPPPPDDVLPRRVSDGCASPPVDRDVNVNGRRGSLTPRQGQGNIDVPLPPPPVIAEPSNNQAHNMGVEAASPSVSHTLRPSPAERIRNQSPYSSNRNLNLPSGTYMAAFRGAPSNIGSKHRERQLEVLHRLEEKFRNRSPKPQSQRESPVPSPLPPVTRQLPLHLCRLSDPDNHESLPLCPEDRRFCIFSTVVSSDGREILGGANDGYLYVYDLECNQRALRIDGHGEDVNTVAFADSTSQILYSGGDDGLCKVWDRRTLNEASPKPVGVLAGHMDGITYIDSKGDSRYLISNSKDQSIKLWDIRVFSSDDAQEYTRKVVSEQNWDYRWQNAPKKLINMKDNLDGDTSVMTYRGHSVLQTLIRCHFSPAETTGQRFVYTGCASGRIVVYDLLTGEIEKVFNGHTGCVRDVAWHPYRPEITSTSWDYTVVVWGYNDYSDSEDEVESPPVTVKVRRSSRIAELEKRRKQHSTNS